MAGHHKYIKRTGSPGNYKYWYKLPDGRMVSSDDAASPKEHAKAKREHLRRLIQAKAKGHHRMSKEEMLRHTGVSKEELEGSGNKHIFANAARRGHQWDEHEIATAHKVEEQDKTGASEEAPAPASAATTKKKTRKKAASRTRTAEATAEAASASRTVRKKKTSRRAAPAAPAAPAESIRAKLSGYSDQMVHQFENGMMISTPGEIEGEKTTPFTSYREEAKSEILKQVKKNADAGKFTVGFKYLDLDGTNKPYPEALASYGFELVSQAEPDSTGRTKTVMKHPSGIVFSSSSDRGGYSNLTGPTEETYKMMKKILGDAAYVKDVSPFYDGLHGQPTDEEYNAAIAGGGEEAPATPSEVQSLLDKLKNEHGIDLTGGTPAAAPAEPTPIRNPEADARRARAAAARAAAVASPSSAAARELHQEEPELAAADEPIAAMEREAARGGNPYLSRAKQIFENIQGDLDEKRRKTVGNFLQAIQNLQEGGRALTQANMLSEYQSVVGNRRTTSLKGIAEELEKGTFITLDEIVNNEPINAEVERMKRGYAAMQFARMKPFLKESWKSANPSAPPPFPTFGDVKSWTEHGGPKPEWAGTTRLALPKSVFDAAAKGPDGKPKYPPPDMPIHHMPVWNYIVKKAERESAASRKPVNPYADPYGSPYTQGQINTGTQSRRGDQLRRNDEGKVIPEGIYTRAVRKYVKMRGGANQLVDIPSMKLGEIGLTHRDIFKSEGDMDSMQSLKKILQTKIVDPVALMPFVKQEIEAANHPYDIEEEIGKSIRLVVDADKPEVNFRKSFTVELSKSEKIKRIKDLRRKYFVGR